MSIGNKENGFKIKKTGEGGISYVYQISEDTVAKLTPISEKPLKGLYNKNQLDLAVNGEDLIINNSYRYSANKRELFFLCSSMRELLVLKEINQQGVKNITPVKDFYFASIKGYLHTVLEIGYAPGDLVTRLVREKNNLADVSKIVSDIAETLLQISELGIIHRDIKPSNIKYEMDGSLGAGKSTLIDFGLVSRVTPWPDYFDSDLISLLENKAYSKSTGGTFLYFSPEYTKNMEPSLMMDCFSLGLTAYQLLVGNHAPISPDYPISIASLDYATFGQSFHLPRLKEYNNFQRDILIGILYNHGCPKDLAEAVGICLDQVPERRSLIPLKKAAEKISRLEVPISCMERYNRDSPSPRILHDGDSSDISDI